MNYRTIILLSLPLIMANISIPLCSLVHSSLMGHLSDSKYLTVNALGITIVNSITYLFYFLRIGTTGVIAQYFGRKEWNSIARVLLQYLLIAFIIGVFLMMLQQLIYYFAIIIFYVSEHLSVILKQYYSIVINAVILILLKYVFLGFFIAVQKPVVILCNTLLSNSISVILSTVLVLRFGYNIHAIAYTIVATEITAIIYYITVSIITLKKNKVDLCAILISPVLRRFKSYNSLLGINTHIFLRSLLLVLSINSFYVFSSYLDKNTLAANSLILECATFLAIFLDALTDTTETLVAKSYINGKKDWHQVIKKSRRCVIITAILLTIVYGSSCHWIIDQLTSIDQVRSIAKQYIIFSVCFPLCAVYSFWLDSICIGLLKTQLMCHAMLKAVVGYIILVLVLWPYGNHGLWLAFLTFFIFRAIALAKPLNKLLLKDNIN